MSNKLKKLTFEVNNYDLVEMADSEIMKVKMYIVSEGDNAHSMPISWDAIQEAKATLVGKPIVAKYDKWKKDLEGHEVDEIPVGVILREEDIFEEVDENGKRWLGAMGDIWMRYSQDVTGVLIRDMVKSLSMEILVAEESDNGEILAFAFTGITLIGSDKDPAIKNAKLEVLTFESVKDNIEKLMFTGSEDGEKMEKNFELSHEDIRRSIDIAINPDDKYEYWIREVFADYFIMEDNMEVDTHYKVKYEIVDDEVKVYLDEKETVKMKWIPQEKGSEENFEEEKEVDMECGENKMEEEEAESKEVKEEKMTSDAYVENSAQEANQEAVAEQQKEQAEEQNKPEMMEIEKSKYEYYIKLEEDYKMMKDKYEKLEMESKAMKEDKDAYMEEFERLQKFENDYNEARFSAEVEATFAEVEDMPSEVIEKFKESAKEFTLENIDDWKNQVLAEAYKYSKGKVSTSKYNRIAINVETQTKQKPKGLWGHRK